MSQSRKDNRPSRIENNNTNRPKRSKVAGARDKLAVIGKDPNYHYRIVNDQPGRVAYLLSLGYEIVQDEKIKFGQRIVDTGSNIGSVNSMPLGKGDNGVLMRIPKDEYAELRAESQEEIDATEADLHEADRRSIDGYGEFERGTTLTRR